jgi:hypothetical protein
MYEAAYSCLGMLDIGDGEDGSIEKGQPVKATCGQWQYF